MQKRDSEEQWTTSVLRRGNAYDEYGYLSQMRWKLSLCHASCRHLNMVRVYGELENVGVSCKSQEVFLKFPSRAPTQGVFGE
jgi:hypothetical protein